MLALNASSVGQASGAGIASIRVQFYQYLLILSGIGAMRAIKHLPCRTAVWLVPTMTGKASDVGIP